MTYGQFLLIFLVLPITALAWLLRRELTRRQLLAASGVALVAFLYTPIWDNLLVANRVWWYDPDRVAGITLGWVPLEEYLFFVLQPVLVGLWMLFLRHRLPPAEERVVGRPGLWRRAMLAVGMVWVGSVVLLASAWDPGFYLGLILVWALPPVMLQLDFGADILRSRRRWVALGIIPAVLYLVAADALAIGLGIWTINPETSLQVYLLGVLPVEEFVFFLMTSTLVAFSVTLTLEEASFDRLNLLVRRIADRRRAWRVDRERAN